MAKDRKSLRAEARGTATKRQRRIVGTITSNACTECKKRRAKCDGERPCSACATRNGQACVYSLSVRAAKSEMLEQMSHLDLRCQTMDLLLKAIASDTNTGYIVQQLREGKSYESIANQLAVTSSPEHEGSTSVIRHRSVSVKDNPTTSTDRGEGKDSQTFHGDLQRAQMTPISTDLHPEPEQAFDGARPALPPPIPNTLSIGKDRSSNEFHRAGRNVHHPPSNFAGQHVDTYTDSEEQWTNVTADKVFIEHLISLYFCWEHPTFTTLSKIHFLRDFASGRRRYCSPLLVNAMLALACQFSDKPGSRADPGNSDTAGDHFFQEAKTLLIRERDHSLTTIQALALMSLREASCGRESIGHFYALQSFQMAMETESRMDHTGLSGASLCCEEREVCAATFWGCFCLDQTWSLFLRRLPYMSRFAIHTPLPIAMKDAEAEEWVPYTDEGLSRVRDGTSPRDSGLAFNSLCELSTSINDALCLVHKTGTRSSGQETLKAHAQYLSWYSSLPESLRHGQNFTPSALFVHMYYHCAIILLFRPFLNRPLEQSIPSARDICAQAADGIATLMGSYRQLHTARRTPTFLPYILSNADSIHLGGTSAPTV